MSIIRIKRVWTLENYLKKLWNTSLIFRLQHIFHNRNIIHITYYSNWRTRHEENIKQIWKQVSLHVLWVLSISDLCYQVSFQDLAYTWFSQPSIVSIICFAFQRSPIYQTSSFVPFLKLLQNQIFSFLLKGDNNLQREGRF